MAFGSRAPAGAHRVLFAIRWLTPPANFRRASGSGPLDAFSKRDFMRAWSAVAYLFPGLHPDGFEDDGSGWPRVLKPFAAEAWRRNEADELEDAETYPCAALWAGIFDRFI